MFENGTAADYRDLAERLHTFLTTNGSAFGLTYAGTGNGTLTAYRGGAGSVAETFTITATSATNWTVVGSVSGSIGPATTGTPFSHAKLAFTITAGGTAFVSGDVFTLATAPKWTAMRRERGATVTADAVLTGNNAAENVISGLEAIDNSQNWLATGQVHQLEVVLFDAKTVTDYAILGTSTHAPRSWTFEYWNGSTWVVLDTRSNVTNWLSGGSLNRFSVGSPVSAARYRLNVTQSQSGSSLQIHQVKLLTSSTGHNVAFGQYIWRAPGNDGASEIFVGLHHFRRVDADYFDWELAGFDGFDAQSEFYLQPNTHTALYLPLLDASIPYWFIADGRRTIVVAKVGSQYEVAYLGLLEPYFTPQQMPYPLAIGGSLAFSVQPLFSSTDWRWSNTTNRHRAMTHADPNATGSGHAVRASQMRVRGLDGAWHGHFATYSDNFNAPNGVDDWIWPTLGDLYVLDVNLDGGYSLWPVLLLQATPNTPGQLSGITVLTGQGQTAESTVRIGAIDHLVLPNINRVDRNDWFAVRLD